MALDKSVRRTAIVGTGVAGAGWAAQYGYCSLVSASN